MKVASRITTMPTLVAPPRAEPAPRLWSRREYYQLGAEGYFDDQRVELIEGEIIQMPPIQEPHVAGVDLVRYALEVVFGRKFWVRTQAPLHLRRRSVPQPDAAVVPGRPGSYRTAPTSALLIVEVSESSLAFDRGRKASLYASAGIGDYWILNLVHRQLEVCRKPAKDPSQVHGYGYADVRIMLPGESISPFAAPKARIKVADLLP
jgi:Uma2 family endonuclease